MMESRDTAAYVMNWCLEMEQILTDLKGKEIEGSETEKFGKMYQAAASGTDLFLNCHINPYRCRDRLEQMLYEQEHELLEEMVIRYLLMGLEQKGYCYESLEQMQEELEYIGKSVNAYETCLYGRLFQGGYRYMVPAKQVQYSLESIEWNGEEFHRQVALLERALVTVPTEYPLNEYFFQGLWFLEKKFSCEISREDRRSLICSGITCATHNGDFRQALKLYEQLESGQETDFLKEISLEIRLSVAYEDCFQYRTAVQMLKSCKERLERYIPRPEEEIEYQKALGRCYSGLGCALVYVRENPMPDFNRALEIFREDGEKWQRENRAITLSHLQHYYIDCQRREPSEENLRKFELAQGRSFQEDTDLAAHLEQLCSEEHLPLFELWVFLKGVNCFYMDRIGKKFETVLMDFVHSDHIRKYNFFVSMLILRYAGNILYQYKEPASVSAAQEAYQKSMEVYDRAAMDEQKPLNIANILNYHTMWQYNRNIGYEERNKKLLKTLKKHAEQDHWQAFADRIDADPQLDLDALLFFEQC